MTEVRHIRFHGRGGEGVKLASRITSRALFLAGFTVQDSPLYGAERRGAPVVAFVRFASGPIDERGYIVAPAAVVVMDGSLLDLPEAAVLDGCTPETVLLVNLSPEQEAKRRPGLPGKLVACDLSSLALATLGSNLLSAPTAAATARLTGVVEWEHVRDAVTRELTEAGQADAAIEKNLAVARRAFEQVPVLTLAARSPTESVAVPVRFEIPRLGGRTAAPVISVGGGAAQRHTDGWRIWRPVIETTRCTRCFLCFALCPEGAIQLDTDNFPRIDYDHCKGCLICVAECPPKVITQVREERR